MDLPRARLRDPEAEPHGVNRRLRLGDGGLRRFLHKAMVAGEDGAQVRVVRFQELVYPMALAPGYWPWRCFPKKVNTLFQPSIACSGR